jgi:Spy/CpxP family protein refolding chaperone
MNNLSRAVAVGAMLSVAMLAQRPFGVVTSSTPPDPATIVAHRVARLTKLLDLNTTQAGTATTIFTNSLAAVTPLETSLSTDRQSLAAAVKSNDTATIESLATSIGTVTGQIIAIQNKADAAFYAILSPTQQTTLNQSKGAGGHGGFGRGSGGPPPGH